MNGAKCRLVAKWVHVNDLLSVTLSIYDRYGLTETFVRFRFDVT